MFWTRYRSYPSSEASRKNMRPAEDSEKGNVMEGSWNAFDLETGLLVGGANSRRRSDRGEVGVVNLKHEDPEGKLLKVSG